MKLEQEIHQGEFKNMEHKSLINLMYTYGYIVNKMAFTFKEFNITRQQYNVLRILRGQFPNPTSINLIKERMLDKMSDASRIVDRLKLKKLIVKKTSKTDKRGVDILISEEGLKMLKLLDSKVDEFNHFFDNLNQDELKTLNDLLDKVRG